jgi:hypothetical protein
MLFFTLRLSSSAHVPTACIQILPLLLCASPAASDIKAGWGISFNPANFTSFRATAPCPADMYGVAAETFGLISAPCKACTKNLRSPPGSTSFADCKNRAGFGYTSEGANQVRPCCCCCGCTHSVATKHA